MKIVNLEELKEYFKNTPREQIEKDWAESEKYDQIGPTVLEYQELIKKVNKPFEKFTSGDFDAWDNLD